MVFADPKVCPSCSGSIDQATVCPHCGLNLTTHEVRQAWQALVVADQWMDRARHVQASGAPVSPTAEAPQHPSTATTAAPPARRSVSAGSVLLSLGALAIVVAGLIFVSVSWGALGVLGRALVLLTVTAIFGLTARFVTRRGLRASSEALWSVFLALLTLDWFAARDQGLAGLDAWPVGVSASVWMVAVVGAALLIVPLGRRHLDGVDLVAPSVAAGAAGWVGATAWVGQLSDALDGDRGFWGAVVATAVVGAVALVLSRASMRVSTWVAVAGILAFGLLAVGMAVGEAVDHPSWSQLAGEAHGLPLLVVAVLAACTGLVLQRTRVVASAVAVGAAATLGTVPVEDSHPERGGYIMVAVLVALGAWAFAATGDWRRGGRWAVGLAGMGLAVAASPWVGNLLAVAAEGATGDRAHDLAAALRPDDAPDVGPWWVALVVTAGLAAGLLGARRWPEAADVRAHLAPAAWCTAVVGTWSAFATFDVPAASVGGELLVGGALLSLVLPREGWWRWVGPAALALAPLVTISSWPATVIVWPVAGVLLAAVALRANEILLRTGAAFAATAWGLGAAGPALELADGDDRWSALALIVAGLVGLAAALPVRPQLPRLGVQVAAALLGGLGLAVASTVSTTAFASFAWTVAGAGVVLVSLVPPRDSYLRWIGAGLLGVAYVLRLAASDVEVVEAYTAPFAVLLVVAGLWAMRRDAQLGTVRALSAGALLTFIPSLPQALDEPTGLRALLLGLVAAVSLGVGTWRKSRVPFVAGAIVLGLLVLVNVGPLTLALPRWVLIAAVGAVLLAVGITWEDRVRDGRAAVRYVGSMR